MEHTTAKSFYHIFKEEGLSFGRKTAKKERVFFLQIFVIMGVVNAIPNVVNWLNHWPQDTNNIGDPISLILSLILGFWMIKIFLHFVHGKIPTLTELWSHKAWRFLWWLLAKIIQGVLVGIGTILLIIPGIYVGARLYLYEYFVVDQDMNSIEAISASWEITKWHVWEIVGIMLMSFGIIILGALALGIGLIWAIPTVKLAQATLYKKLTSHDQHLE